MGGMVSGLIVFLREAEVLQFLGEHYNIVKFFDWAMVKQHSVMVFERIRHTDPTNITRIQAYIKGTLQVTLVIHQLSAWCNSHMLQALVWCHEHGVIHCDIKQSNIRFDAVFKRAVVIDFGLAIYYDPNNDPPTSVSGTEGKHAPEMLEETPYDYAVDMWSLGVVFAELVCSAPYNLWVLTFCCPSCSIFIGMLMTLQCSIRK